MPPYSSDFNPIEQAFAKLKAFLRAARPRNFDEVTTLIGLALDFFSPLQPHGMRQLHSLGSRPATSSAPA